MAAVGFRCWRERLAFVILDGSKASPNIVMHGMRAAPANATESQIILWTSREVHEILNGHPLTAGAYKAEEPFSQRKSLARARVEGAVIQAAVSHPGSLELPGLTKANIKAALRPTIGVALDETLAEVGCAACDRPNLREAAWAALCALPD